MFEDWEVISRYSRAQAIADGVLVDLDAAPFCVRGATLREALGIRHPVAITGTAFAATVGAFSQTVARFLLSRVLCAFKLAAEAASADDRCHFTVRVNHSDRCEDVALWALCGPGDTPAPVITIMLEGED